MNNPWNRPMIMNIGGTVSVSVSIISKIPLAVHGGRTNYGHNGYNNTFKEQ